SRSYGPGRYDASYEAGGHDYPFAYVRWTLNRNMESYLELVAGGAVRFGALVDRVVPIDEAPLVYDQLAKGEGTLPLAVLLQYGDEPEADAEPARVKIRGHRKPQADRINYALVGAGAFGTAMLVPQMKKRGDRFFLRGVHSPPGAEGSTFARDNRGEVLASDLDVVLRGDAFQLMVTATRHDDHAAHVVRSLGAGKHVFVEKPLAISWD